MNFGAPGDRRDQTGKLWLSWPRPSDNPRNKSTDKTGLALTFDLKTTFAAGGGFVSHDGDATVTDSPELTWVTSSGGRGLTRFSIPLLGADDTPEEYTVRLHFAPAPGSETESQLCSVAIQDKRVLKSLDVPAEKKPRVVREFSGIQVTNNLVVELAPASGTTESLRLPIVCGIEVIQTNGDE
jgi:hypothetical protein